MRFYNVTNTYVPTVNDKHQRSIIVRYSKYIQNASNYFNVPLIFTNIFSIIDMMCKLICVKYKAFVLLMKYRSWAFPNFGVLPRLFFRLGKPNSFASASGANVL